MANFIVGTYYQVLTIATGIDLTNQTALDIEFRKPSGATDTITSGVGVLGDPTNGNMTYTVAQGEDLWDEDGVYLGTPGVTTANGLHKGGTPFTVTIRRVNQYS
jgi:hypothetical protein